MLKIIRAVALLLIALLGGLWAYAWAMRAPGEGMAEALSARFATVFGGAGSAVGGLQLPQGLALGGPFSLTDQAGRAVTEKDFAGSWMLVYFGYTYCPDVCPTELGVMAAAMDALGPLGERVVPVFISVDPQRDDVAHLADYVSRFHPRLQGLTGTPAQVAEAARRYRVYYARVESAGHADYLMDHSSFIYLVGPDSKVRALFRPEAKPDDIAASVTAQLGATRLGR